jgi:hypothetical protein
LELHQVVDESQFRLVVSVMMGVPSQAQTRYDCHHQQRTEAKTS